MMAAQVGRAPLLPEAVVAAWIENFVKHSVGQGLGAVNRAVLILRHREAKQSDRAAYSLLLTMVDRLLGP